MMRSAVIPRFKQALISSGLAQSTHIPGNEAIKSIIPSEGLHFMAKGHTNAVRVP